MKEDEKYFAYPENESKIYNQNYMLFVNFDFKTQKNLMRQNLSIEHKSLCHSNSIIHYQLKT